MNYFIGTYKSKSETNSFALCAKNIDSAEFYMDEIIADIEKIYHLNHNDITKIIVPFDSQNKKHLKILRQQDNNFWVV